MKPTKQTVYLPVKVEDITKHPNITLVDIRGIDTFCSEQEAFVFTPEQLNEYTRNVGKTFLENAAENVEPDYWKGSCELCGSNVVDKESITNTFEETFKKFQV